ncbi:4Fe-4S dicluster domain-containing protein [Ilyobacter sp.]|uniref:4Fe-4S dicluster domain-containing protein n=1 Tax=Ilyobacter sp. TaxID=3100343 RepID=UPI00356783EE
MDIVQKIREAGIVGAGGAGFPTHIKFSVDKVDYLLVNGAECEPLLQIDKYLMREKSSEIIKVLEQLGDRIQAKEIHIALKGKYKSEIIELEKAIKDLNSRVKIFKMGTYYPAGDEQQIVFEVTGRTVPEAGIPLDVGVIVTNVGTLVNIYEAVTDSKPVVDKCLSIHGEVKNPLILKSPIGMTLAKCIEAAGGTTIDKYKIIVGGPMMGRIIDKESLEKEVVTKTTGALIVVPEDHYMVHRNGKSVKHIINEAKSSCIQCRMCTDLCPRYLIGQKLRPHRIMRSVSMLENNSEILKEALLCCECGICELFACPMQISPRMVNVYLKGVFRENGVRFEKSTRKLTAESMREYRKVPTNRLISRIGMSKYTDFSETKAVILESNEVSIPLKQHIGAPAKPLVGVGDHVEYGQLIGEVKEGLGASVHASIAGVVVEVGNSVVIKK